MAMNMAGSAGRRRTPRPASRRRDGGDQRHADGRRDAGAADHLHGGGAADDVEHRYRSAGRQRRQAIQANAPPLTLSVKRTGGACNSNVELYLGDTLISANDLLPKIKAIRETRSEAESVVYLRGDKDVCYTDMMKLLGYIRTAGFKANIVIVPEQGS